MWTNLYSREVMTRKIQERKLLNMKTYWCKSEIYSGFVRKLMNRMRNKNFTALSGNKNIYTYCLNCLWFKVISFTDFGKVCVVCVRLSHLLENIINPIHQQRTEPLLLSMNIDEESHCHILKYKRTAEEQIFIFKTESPFFVCVWGGKQL